MCDEQTYRETLKCAIAEHEQLLPQVKRCALLKHLIRSLFSVLGEPVPEQYQEIRLPKPKV